MKILVADDDPISRKVIEGCLSDAGYDVTVAVDGAEALEMISKPDSPRMIAARPDDAARGWRGRVPGNEAAGARN